MAATLVALWGQWANVVEAVASARMPALTAAAYGKLQAGLLEECRAHVERGNAAQRPEFQRITDIVQPWLTLDTLAKIDAATLASLLARCRQIDAKLGIATKQTSSGVLVVFAVMIAAGLTWFASATSGRWLRAVNLSLSSLWQVIEKHPLLSLAFLLPLILATAVFLLKRVLRS